MEITKGLLCRDINGYSDAGAARKQTFHKEGKKFLKQLAEVLGITAECDVRSNLGGVAVSGEVTLHGDRLYVQLYEYQNGVQVLYRACTGRKDYTGGQNNNANMQELAQDYSALDLFVARLKKMM